MSKAGFTWTKQASVCLLSTLISSSSPLLGLGPKYPCVEHSYTMAPETLDGCAEKVEDLFSSFYYPPTPLGSKPKLSHTARLFLSNTLQNRGPVGSEDPFRGFSFIECKFHQGERQIDGRKLARVCGNYIGSRKVESTSYYLFQRTFIHLISPQSATAAPSKFSGEGFDPINIDNYLKKIKVLFK